MAGKFSLKMPDFHIAFRDLLHAVNLQHGTHSFTSLLKEGMLMIFFVLKNPAASARFEPANLGSKGQHATSRPPKPLLDLGEHSVNHRWLCSGEDVLQECFHTHTSKDHEILGQMKTFNQTYTIRSEIAACLEKAYEKISLNEAARMLNLTNQTKEYGVKEFVGISGETAVPGDEPSHLWLERGTHQERDPCDLEDGVLEISMKKLGSNS